MPAKLLSTEEAAERLGITERMLRKDARDGCPHTSKGRALRWKLSEVRAWRKANRRTTVGGNHGGGRPRTATAAQSPSPPAENPPKKPPKKPPPVADDTVSKVAALIGSQQPTLGVAEASALKSEIQAALLTLELRRVAGELVDVSDLQVALKRGLHAARRYLDTSQRATALRICDRLGVHTDRAAEVEEELDDRDTEFCRRMRSCMDDASGDAVEGYDE